jgi:phage terminase Nu1 subunit (DNA packaging protein)
MNDTAPAPALVRKKKLAQLFGVSPRTVDSWVASGVIPYIAPSSRLHLFDAAQVKSVLTAKFGFTPKATN